MPVNIYPGWMLAVAEYIAAVNDENGWMLQTVTVISGEVMPLLHSVLNFQGTPVGSYPKKMTPSPVDVENAAPVFPTQVL